MSAYRIRPELPPFQKEYVMSKYKNKIFELIYVALTAFSLIGGGWLATYLAKDMPEGHTTFSAFMTGICTLALAIYFGINAVFLAIKNHSD